MNQFIMDWIDFCRHWETMCSMSKILSDSQYYVYHGLDIKQGRTSLAQSKVYSECFRQIVLSAAAEFEVMCKVLCSRKGKKPGNIIEISQDILESYSHITEMEILTPFYNFSPFAKWAVIKDEAGKRKVVGLDWWNDYNVLKHANSSEFKKATLDSAIKALGSLFSIDLYVLYTLMGNLLYANDYPSAYFKFSPYVLGGKEYNRTLPDFKVEE